MMCMHDKPAVGKTKTNKTFVIDSIKIFDFFSKSSSAFNVNF